jgi:hypothetical protein
MLALAMPVRYLFRVVRRRAAPGEGWLVLKQTSLALGIMLAIGLTGLAVGIAVLRLRGETVMTGPVAAIGARIGAASPVQISAVLLTFLVLAAILLIIEALGVLASRGRKR